MILAAQQTYIAGGAVPGLGVRISPQGTIEAVAKLHTLGPPTHLFAGQCLLPGLVDVCALNIGKMLHRVVHHGLPVAKLLDALKMKLAQGITTVGVPIGPPQQGAEANHASTKADLLSEMAHAVGLRLAILHDCSLRPATGANRQSAFSGGFDSFDDAAASFERMVQHIVALNNPRLSWALVADVGPNMPIDALTALRLRYAHLPCLFDLTRGPRKDRPTPQIVQTLAAHKLFDACTALMVCGQPTGAELQACLRWGVTWVQCDGTATSRPSSEGQAPLPVHHSFAMHPSITARGFTNDVTTEHISRLKPTSSGGMRALGLKGGTLSLGSWADLRTILWPSATEPLVISSSAEADEQPTAAVANRLYTTSAQAALVAGSFVLKPR